MDQKTANNSYTALSTLSEAESLENKARIAAGLRKFTLAESLLKQALSLKEKAVGQDSHHVATTLNDLGYVENVLGRYQEAEEHLKRAVSILEKAYYADHGRIAPVLSNLGDCYERQNRHQDAEPVLKRALDIYGKTLAGDHYLTLASNRRLVELYIKLEKWADADALLKKALKAADRPLGPLEEFLFQQALLYEAQGKNEEAEKAYREALSQFQQRNKPHREADTIDRLIGLLKKMSKNEEVSGLQTKSDQLRKKYSENPSEIFTSNMV